jgi:hypothetical protein
MKWFVITFLALTFLDPSLVFAAATDSSAPIPPVTLAVQITGSELSYGDLISYDQKNAIFTLSRYQDDPDVYGVAVQDPALVLYLQPSNVPVMREGKVLLNVTLEGGAIAPGDPLTASSIPGKAMRASTTSEHIIAVARESFTGLGTSTPLSYQGKTFPAGTIIADIGSGIGALFGTGKQNTEVPPPLVQGCVQGDVACNIAQKIDATPIVTLMRYLLAALIALGALYLAFRSFMLNAANGVISVGRNPRAKGAIQAMVAFNAILAGLIALGGIAAGLLILFIRI